MILSSNIHTHSTFCDGENTIEENVIKAIELGFESIGFSSHAYTGFDFDECGIKKENIDNYFNELERVKEKYKGRIKIFKGLELESRVLKDVRPTIDNRLDYTIGSVHMINIDNKYYSVDYTPDIAAKAIELTSPLEYAKLYFEELASFAEDTPFDIVGHFDLITKFNEKKHLFSENDEYRNLALSYLERIARTGKIFEVNTGAMKRGWKSIPYPAPFLLERLNELGGKIIITSDAHNKDGLDYAFNDALTIVKKAGFKKLSKLTEDGFVEFAI